MNQNDYGHAMAHADGTKALRHIEDLICRVEMLEAWHKRSIGKAEEEAKTFAAANDAVRILADACLAALMFHQADIWNLEKAEAWFELTGERSATTRALCKVLRAALDAAKIEAQQQWHGSNTSK